MKTIVTGAAGFIGSHVVDALIEAGVTVVALDDLSGGFPDHVNPRASFVQGSAASHEKASHVFKYRAQTGLAEGLARMAAWAKGVGSRQSQPFRGIEIRRGLPSAWRESGE